MYFDTNSNRINKKRGKDNYCVLIITRKYESFNYNSYI